MDIIPQNTAKKEVIKNYSLSEMIFQFDLTKDDEKNIESVCPQIKELVKSEFQNINIVDSKEINKILDNNAASKEKYLKDAVSTYILLYSSINTAFKNVSVTSNTNGYSENFDQINIQIKGAYEKFSFCRTIEDWKKCNKGKWDAIDFFIKQLESKGWLPYINLNMVKVDEDGHMAYYTGGDILILSCKIK